MRRFLLAICLSIAMGMTVKPAFAVELWDYHLRGVNEGLAAGVLAPPGLYLINTLIFAPSFHDYGVTDAAGAYHAAEANSNTKIFAWIDVPVLFWSSGCKFLGGDYGAAISEPVDYVSTRVQTGLTGINPLGTNSEFGSAQTGASNTTFVPIILGWHLPCDFHVKTALSIGANDGTTSPGDSVASNTKVAGIDLPGLTKVFTSTSKSDGNLYLWSSNDSWAFAPHLGISWLHQGWNISADLIYTWYTKDNDTNYQSGDQFFGDYTVSYTCGRWTFGLGAQSTTQVQNDKFAVINPLTGTSSYGSQPNTRFENYAAGPMIGYNFGPCSLMFIYNFALETKNDVGGDYYAVRLVVPLGNPYPLGGR
ncbi:conserved exported hypothetical protein [Syntrophobacter sp. SbD1]|nr:conserved exported hypothetical protein [Syntrophobacter sp. SbD1]